MHKASPVLVVCIFLLCLTSVSPQCRAGTAAECSSTVNYVPGFSWAQYGVDITKLVAYRDKRERVMDLREWQTQSGGCTVCENPLRKDVLNSNLIQKLPSGVTDWKANISCQQKVHHSGPLSAISLAAEMTKLFVKNDWKKGLNLDAKFSAVQWVLSGSDNVFVDYFEWKRPEDKFIFFLHQVSCSYYKFRVNNNSVSNIFKDNVDALLPMYDNSSKHEYQDLIRTYGTHVMTELDLGAGLIYLSALPVCKMQLEGVTVSEVNHCLELEVSIIIGLKTVTQDPVFQKCEKTLEKILGTNVVPGGELSEAIWLYHLDLSENPVSLLESVKTHPGLISYSLEPLHTLVDITDPRRDSLKQAESEYVGEHALWGNCNHSCPPGVQQSALVPCSCECPSNNSITSMCCPQKWGVAKLTVTIVGASGLWGDFITRSDGYVWIYYEGHLVTRTPTIWNCNNPKWNVKFDFGTINIHRGLRKLELAVWDQDFGWDDDLLGKCSTSLNPGGPTDHFCYLDHGSLHYRYYLTCGPNLGGILCSDYIHPWNSPWIEQEKKKYFHKIRPKQKR
ncbi:hypothetical protein lerEdw1_020760 [Lerista edwardsae]|nr:hypothetical protein lerEdw1_020760 [Lerista edwardsae]